jgi:hypothetical protein
MNAVIPFCLCAVSASYLITNNARMVNISPPHTRAALLLLRNGARLKYHSEVLACHNGASGPGCRRACYLMLRAGRRRPPACHDPPPSVCLPGRLSVGAACYARLARFRVRSLRALLQINIVAQLFGRNQMASGNNGRRWRAAARLRWRRRRRRGSQVNDDNERGPRRMSAQNVSCPSSRPRFSRLASARPGGGALEARNRADDDEAGAAQRHSERKMADDDYCRSRAGTGRKPIVLAGAPPMITKPFIESAG